MRVMMGFISGGYEGGESTVLNLQMIQVIILESDVSMLLIGV